MGSKVIIDVDTGVDDAQALMMAASQDDVDILAVTCVTGNVHVDQVITNTLRVLRVCDRLDVPVYKGSVLSLLGMHTDSAYHHGDDGMGGVPDPDPPSHDLVQPKHAVTAMIDIVDKHPGEVTLIALAPLTNVAMAIRLDPQFGSKLKKIVIMGGNIHARGSASTSADFNFLADPEAARIVLSDICGQLTVLPHETCRNSDTSWDWFDRLMATDTKKGRFHNTINQHAMHRRKEVLKLPGYVSCDPLTMAVALDSAVAMETTRKYCTVELNGCLTRGQMVVDWNSVLGKPPNVEIVMKVDLVRVKQYYEGMLK